MGLHLEGELAGNLEHLRIFCAARRFLVVLEGAAPDYLIFGGRCSTLISTEPGEPSPDTLRQLARAFDAAEDWTEACRLARQARRVAHEQFRLAECFEIMNQWRAMAEENDDRPVVEEASRELVWILDGGAVRRKPASWSKPAPWSSTNSCHCSSSRRSEETAPSRSRLGLTHRPRVSAARRLIGAAR